MLEIEEDPTLLENFLFCDERHFHLRGGVPRHNFRYWSDENPQWYAEELLNSPPVTLWVGIGQSGAVRPCFFTENINAHRYLTMLHGELVNLDFMVNFYDQTNRKNYDASPCILGPSKQVGDQVNHFAKE